MFCRLKNFPSAGKTPPVGKYFPPAGKYFPPADLFPAGGKNPSAAENSVGVGPNIFRRRQKKSSTGENSPMEQMFCLWCYGCCARSASARPVEGPRGPIGTHQDPRGRRGGICRGRSRPNGWRVVEGPWGPWAPNGTPGDSGAREAPWNFLRCMSPWGPDGPLDLMGVGSPSAQLS